MLFRTLFIVIWLQIFSLVNPVLAKVSYLFSQGCGHLENQRWGSSQECDPQSSKFYDFKLSPNLFCQITLPKGKPLGAILDSIGYFRNHNSIKALSTKNGQIMNLPSSGRLIFSKRDLMIKNKNRCKAVNNISNSDYILLDVPISLYVLRTGLKTPAAQFIPKVPIKKLSKNIKKHSPIEKNNFNENKYDLNLSYRAFYETLTGTQVSNSTKAKIASQLSPSLIANLKIKQNDTWSLKITSQVDFHLFKKDTSLFSVTSENVISPGLSFSILYNFNQKANLIFTTGIENELHYVRESASSIKVKKNISPDIGLSSEIFIIKHKNLYLKWQPTISYSFEGQEFSNGFSISTPLTLSFKRSYGSFGAFLNFEQRENKFTELNVNQKVFSFGLSTGYKF